MPSRCHSANEFRDQIRHRGSRAMVTLGTVCHSLNGRYSLRKTIVPAKRLQDYHVEGVSLSKRNCTRARTSGPTGDSSSQAPFYLPVSTVDHSGGRLILRIKFPRPQEAYQDEHVGHFLSISDPLPGTGTSCTLGKERYGLSNSTETLEIANILLGLGEHENLQNAVQQPGSTSQGAPLVLERSGHQRLHQDHHVTSSAIICHGHSCGSKGRRKKQANPRHIVPGKVQAQDIKVHAPQTGHQNISGSGLDNAQQGAISGYVASEAKGRRTKQVNPRHIMPSKVQKQDFKVLYVPQPALFCSKSTFAGLPHSLNEILGLPQTPCQGFIRGKELLRDEKKFSPEDIDIPFEWSASPREEEDMFFPHLHVSSYKAEAAERKRREAALQRSLRQMQEPLDERYIKNAAVLPDLRQSTPVSAPTTPILTSKPSSSISRPQPQDEPLKIHGCNVEDFKRIYHSVVDPKLTTKSGNPRPYSLQTGRVIKQRMWETFHCPSFVETEGADGRVWVSEAYCSPSLKPHAPLIDVDISQEPMPEKPKRKRARQ
ncbi:uncharacterized protein LOC134445308 [Engraulis encrasicolus]|uniref:uncharacterized protein LOC134445308 n=1 Tax=Engraulis encrasicolus TaxID=184585 RepID=UPI002FCF1772